MPKTIVWGTKVGRSTPGAPEGVIESGELSPAGNVILRAGVLREDGWEQAAHIVLTPEEAELLAGELRATAKVGARLARKREEVSASG